MDIVLRNAPIRQQDAWLSALALIALPVGVILLLPVSDDSISPMLSSKLFDLTIIVLAEILVLGYCFSRYGRIELEELVPRGQDYVVLAFSILILFWIFGMTVGAEGLRVNQHESIRGLPVAQYWMAAVFYIVIGPLLEETFLRRYFFEILRHHYPTSVAVLFTLAVATLGHLGQPIIGLVWVLVYQVFFTVVYLCSRLGGSVIVHCFVNSLILLLSR